MPNVVITAVVLMGTAPALRALQDALLVEKDDAWTLSVATPERTVTTGKFAYFDRTNAAWDARWLSLSPSQVMLSFCSAWEPPHQALRDMEALAATHNVTLSSLVAIEEYFAHMSHGELVATMPAVWAGTAQYLNRVQSLSGAQQAVLDACAHPTGNHAGLKRLQKAA